jgi:transposase InsO family protein
MTSNKTSEVSVMEPKQGSYREVTRPDPQVPQKPLRRRFTASYKLQVLHKLMLVASLGDIGRLLRGEGLYSSYLGRWRDQRDKGILDGLSSKPRGRKPTKCNPLLLELERLEKENKQLTKRPKQAQLIIEVQKKVSQLL